MGASSPRLGAGGRADAAHHTLDARLKLAQGEGLGDVVIRAHLKAEHLVNHVVLGRQHQDRDVRRLLPQLAADSQPVHFREHEVEDDGVGAVVQGRLDA